MGISQRSVQVHSPVMSVFEKLFSDFHRGMLKEDLIWQSNMTNNLNLMQSSTIRITKISEYVACAENLGIGYSTLTKWLKDFRESGDIPVRGSGNYASDEQKEIARLRRELRDAQRCT